MTMKFFVVVWYFYILAGLVTGIKPDPKDLEKSGNAFGASKREDVPPPANIGDDVPDSKEGPKSGGPNYSSSVHGEEKRVVNEDGSTERVETTHMVTEQVKVQSDLRETQQIDIKTMAKTASIESVISSIQGQPRRSFIFRLLSCNKSRGEENRKAGRIIEVKKQLLRTLITVYYENLNEIKNLEYRISELEGRMMHLGKLMEATLMEETDYQRGFMAFEFKFRYYNFVLKEQNYHMSYIRTLYMHCLRYLTGGRDGYTEAMLKILQRVTSGFNIDKMHKEIHQACGYTAGMHRELVGIIKDHVAHAYRWLKEMQKHFQQPMDNYLTDVDDTARKSVIKRLIVEFTDDMLEKEELYYKIIKIPVQLMSREYCKLFNETQSGGYPFVFIEFRNEFIKAVDINEKRAPPTEAPEGPSIEVVKEVDVGGGKTSKSSPECSISLDQLKVKRPNIFDKHVQATVSYTNLSAHWNGGEPLINGTVGVDNNFDDLPFGLVEIPFKVFKFHIDRPGDKTYSTTYTLNFARLAFRGLPSDVFGEKREDILQYCDNMRCFLEINMVKVPEISKLVGLLYSVLEGITEIFEMDTLGQIAGFLSFGVQARKELKNKLDGAVEAVDYVNSLIEVSINRINKIVGATEEADVGEMTKLIDMPIHSGSDAGRIDTLNLGVMLHHYLRILYMELKDIHRKLIAYHGFAKVVQNITLTRDIDTEWHGFNPEYLRWVMCLLSGGGSRLDNGSLVAVTPAIFDTLNIIKAEEPMRDILIRTLATVNVDYPQFEKFVTLVAKDNKCTSETSTAMEVAPEDPPSFFGPTRLEKLHFKPMIRSTSHVSTYILASWKYLRFPVPPTGAYKTIRTFWNQGFHSRLRARVRDHNFDDLGNDPIDEVFQMFDIDHDIMKCEHKNNHASLNFAKLDSTVAPSQVITCDTRNLFNFLECARCLTLVSEKKLPQILQLMERLRHTYVTTHQNSSSKQYLSAADNEFNMRLLATIDRINALDMALDHFKIIIELCRKRFELLQTLVTMANVDIIRAILDLPIVIGEGERVITATNFAIISHHYFRELHRELKEL